jgi:hypothetical protein
VLAEFSAERISSDCGSLLLRQVDRRINLLKRMAECFIEGRAFVRVSLTLMFG